MISRKANLVLHKWDCFALQSQNPTRTKRLRNFRETNQAELQCAGEAWEGKRQR